MPTPSTSEIRTWALKQGHAVGDRGRISATVVEAYTQAHKTARPKVSGTVRQPKPGRASVKNPRRSPRQGNPRGHVSVTPAAVIDDSTARMTALALEVAELTDRLALVEKQAQADREQLAAVVAASQRRRFRRA